MGFLSVGKSTEISIPHAAVNGLSSG